MAVAAVHADAAGSSPRRLLTAIALSRWTLGGNQLSSAAARLLLTHSSVTAARFCPSWPCSVGQSDDGREQEDRNSVAQPVRQGSDSRRGQFRPRESRAIARSIASMISSTSDERRLSADWMCNFVSCVMHPRDLCTIHLGRPVDLFPLASFSSATSLALPPPSARP